MGAYGTLLWPIYLGVMTGEWRQATPATVTRVRFGVAVILVSVMVLSRDS
jgi:hypothetical protein